MKYFINLPPVRPAASRSARVSFWLALWLLLWLGFAQILPSKASAHVLETDGQIGAVLHISPDDDPVAGETLTLNFDFKDKSGRLQLQDCSCRLRVLRDGQQLAEVPLTSSASQAGGGLGQASYNFPAAAAYQLELSGQAVAPAEFQDFRLRYAVRVSQSDMVPARGSDWRWPVFGAAAVGFALLWLRIKIRASKENKRVR